MTDEKKKVDVKETADSIIRETKAKSNNSQFVLWFAALILGAVLGWMGIPALNEFFKRWRLSPRWQLLAATKKPVLFLHTLLCIPYLLHF